MNDLVIEVPYIAKAGFSNKNQQQPYVQSMMDKWDSYVSPIADATGLPAKLIYAFMYVESRGNANVGTTAGGAQGLMQIDPPTAFDTINYELSTSGLGDYEKSIINCVFKQFLTIFQKFYIFQLMYQYLIVILVY